MEQKAYVKERGIRVRGMLTLDETKVVFTPNKEPENNIVIPYSQIESVNKRGVIGTIFAVIGGIIKALLIVFVLLIALAGQNTYWLYFGNSAKLKFKTKDGQQIVIFTTKSSAKAKKFILEKISAKK